MLYLHSKYTTQISKNQKAMTQQQTKLTNKAKRIILGKNIRLRLALYTRLDIVTQESLRRLCRHDDTRLSHPDIIALICAYEKCEPEELTEVIAYEPVEA